MNFPEAPKTPETPLGKLLQYYIDGNSEAIIKELQNTDEITSNLFKQVVGENFQAKIGLYDRQSRRMVVRKGKLQLQVEQAKTKISKIDQSKKNN